MKSSALSFLIAAVLVAARVMAETVCKCPNSQTTCTCETVQAASCVIRDGVCHTSCKTVPTAVGSLEDNDSVAKWFLASFRGEIAKRESLGSPGNRQLLGTLAQSKRIEAYSYYVFDEKTNTGGHLTLTPDAARQLNEAARAVGLQGIF